MKKSEKETIAIGSVDIYMIEATSNKIEDIPADNIIEAPENHVGRTKDGGTLTYTPTYYTAKSDDGKASRTELTEETASLAFGLITFDEETIGKMIPTSRTSITGGKSRTLIGGIENNNGKVYLVRAVHKDKEKGDIRYTIIGKNVSGFLASYKPNQETTITPSITAEPFEDGTLAVRDYSNTVGVEITGAESTVAVGSTITLTASTAPEGKTVTWTSEDEANATVSTGVVTGVAVGTATIKAAITVDGVTYTDSYIVTVTSASV